MTYSGIPFFPLKDHLLMGFLYIAPHFFNSIVTDSFDFRYHRIFYLRSNWNLVTAPMERNPYRGRYCVAPESSGGYFIGEDYAENTPHHFANVDLFEASF